MMAGRVAQMIGLCRRAGKVVSGETAVEHCIMRNEAKMLILTRDAATRSREKYMRLAREKNIPVICCFTKSELGDLLGKAPRTVAAITDEQMARGIAGTKERGEAGLYTL